MAFGHRAHEHDPFLPRHVLIAAAIILLGAWLRLRGAQGDLWLDEIWSLKLTDAMTAWHEAFWKIVHDNNHPLNTFWLYWAGEGHAPWYYRLSAIVGGTASIVAAGWAFSRSGPSRMLVAMLLTATLYPLVHFGSEARGYGLMIFFSYLAFIAVDRAREDPAPYRFLFAVSVFFAAYSHLSSLPIVFAMSIAYALRFWRDGESFIKSISNTLWFVAPAAAGLAIVGLALIAGLEGESTMWYGGASWYGGRGTTCPPQGCFIAGWDELIGLNIANLGPDIPGLYAGIFGAFVVLSILGLMISGHRRGILYFAIFALTSLIYLGMGQPNVPYGRYFIALYAFVPFLLADILGYIRKSSKGVRLIFAIAFVALIGANILSLQSFFTLARGDYRSAVKHIERNATTEPITIGSDMLFRSAIVFEYYSDHAMAPIAPQNVSRLQPEWLVIVLKEPRDMQDLICLRGDDNTVAYKLDKAYPYWGLSGTHWGVYRFIVPEGLC